MVVHAALGQSGQQALVEILAANSQEEGGPVSTYISDKERGQRAEKKENGGKIEDL